MFTRTVEYAHPREQVWAALTDPAALSSWLMPTDFTGELGAPFRFRTDPGPGLSGTVDCRLVTADAPSRLVWEWETAGALAAVELRLAPTTTGTQLRWRHHVRGGLGGRARGLLLRRGLDQACGQLLGAYLDGPSVPRLPSPTPPPKPRRPNEVNRIGPRERQS